MKHCSIQYYLRLSLYSPHLKQIHKYVNDYLLMKESENSYQLFAWRYLESSLTWWIKCTSRNLWVYLGLFICFSNMIFPLTFIKVWLKPMQMNKRCEWIKTEEGSEYNFFDSTENLSMISFWYHSKWHQRNPWILLRSHSSI